MRVRLSVVAALFVAAVVATGAFGVSGSDAITTIAGSGVRGFGGDGGPATAARLHYPKGIAVDGKGNVYIADRDNLRIRKVSPGGRITTFAGNGRYGSTGDGGPATSARLYHPKGVAADQLGNVYITDTRDGDLITRVRKVSPSGRITAFAGTGEEGFSGDGGPATAAQLSNPAGVAADREGNVYIADGSRVRKVNTGGTITTIAGTARNGFSGDGGPATSAKLNSPWGVAVDGQGNVYIADSNNYRVRKVSPGGTISTIAGNGKPGFSGDGGPATAARVSHVISVAVDGQNNVYIADGDNHRVRKVSPRGTITTIAGTGMKGFSGNGRPATSARLYYPAGVAVDRQGNVFITDTFNQRVRKIGKASAAPGTTATTRATFRSPSANLACEMGGSSVYCQSTKLPHSVRMGLDGRFTLCRGTHCLDNPDETASFPGLGYGRQITVGRFRCLSRPSGFNCTVIQSGKGFLIDRDGVSRVGP